LWVYCSKRPQGFSTFTEGGLLLSKYASSFMPGQFKLSIPLLGDRPRQEKLGITSLAKRSTISGS
jgi:hypothetical protein